MADSVREAIDEQLASIRLIDPHTHINPRSPASTTLADLLGYHYYTELAHSAGMPKAEIEDPGIGPRELVERLISNLAPIENTAQYGWLVEICRAFFGFEGDRIDASNWEAIYDHAEQKMNQAEWPQMVLEQSNVESVFLTNDFDDELHDFDTDTYIPCLRTDDLVFHLAKPATRQRLEAATEISLDGSLYSLRESLKQRFDYFCAHGARACAISLPPSFEPTPVSDGRAATALDHVLRNGQLADDSDKDALSRRVFWTLAELCDEYGLPFDLMIGVNRGVYTDGVYQGQDLFDSRVSLIQYRELFNTFADVKFPISVLASVTNQELVSYAWIFPNVLTNGHWWYSNTPSFIARDVAARLEAVPQTKQIAYYSDAYKLEFVWPKFAMYRRILAGILADHFVAGCGWSEERAIELGRRILRDNVDEVFPRAPGATESVDTQADTWEEKTAVIDPEPNALNPVAATSAALAAGGIGMVEVTAAVDDATTQEELVEDEFTATVDAFDIESDEVEDLAETIYLDPDDSDEFESLAAEPEQLAELTDQEPGDEDLYATLPPEYQQAIAPLDPLPSPEEIQATDVADVELADFSSEQSVADSERIEMEAEDEPLDVGDLLGETEPSDTPMFRADGSFIPGDESLQVRPDPVTGEPTFRISTDDSSDPPR